MTSSLIGKFIIMDREEYEVEESLGTGYFYKIRNINTDREERASVEFINKKVKTYEEDLKEFENKNESTNYDSIKDIIDIKIKNTENKLLQSMKLLSETLSDTVTYINSCKERNVDYSINELGVIQSEGTTIDVLCSKLGTLKEIRKELED